MNEQAPYSPSTVGLARWFFRILGALLAVTGVLALVYARSMHWLAPTLLLTSGIACFALSFHRRTGKVGSAAHAVIDTDALP